MSRYKIRSRGADASVEHIELMRLSFGDAAAVRTAKALPWLLSRKLKGHPTGTFFITLEYKGAVIGSTIIAADFVWLNGAERPAFMPIAINVHPEHRGRGLMMLKALYDLSKYGVVLGIPNDQHFGIHRRLGAVISNSRKVRVIPLNSRAVLARRKSALQTAGPAVNAVLSMVNLTIDITAPRQRRDELIEPLDVFGPDFDIFWHAARQKHNFLCVRSAERMQWRYREAPFSRYAIDVLRRDSAISGVIVTRVSTRKGRRIGEVCDILCVEPNSRDYALLLREAARRFSKENADFGEFAYIGHKALDTAGRRAGFWFHKQFRQVAANGLGARDDESVRNRIDDLHFLRGDHDEDY